MRYTIVSSNNFKKQRQQLKFSGRSKLLLKLDATIELLAMGDSLPVNARSHKLAGELAGLYECHIEPNWLLVYKIDKGKLILFLVATGNHNQLFD